MGLGRKIPRGKPIKVHAYGALPTDNHTVTSSTNSNSNTSNSNNNSNSQDKKKISTSTSRNSSFVGRAAKYYHEHMLIDQSKVNNNSNNNTKIVKKKNSCGKGSSHNDYNVIDMDHFHEETKIEKIATSENTEEGGQEEDDYTNRGNRRNDNNVLLGRTTTAEYRAYSQNYQNYLFNTTGSYGRQSNFAGQGVSLSMGYSYVPPTKAIVKAGFLVWLTLILFIVCSFIGHKLYDTFILK